MRSYSKYILAITTIAFLGACSSPKQEKQTIKLNSITEDKSLSKTEKAEKLALAGEQLITPTSFMFADLVFDQALQLDPKNQRAKLYKLFLAPKMELKGVLSKYKHIAELDQKTKESYQELLVDIPNTELRNFLLDSSASIKTEKEAQALLNKVYDRYNEFRLFLKNNKNLNLTLNLNPLLFSDRIDDEKDKCHVQKVDDATYDIANCDISDILQIKLDRADVEVLQHYVAGIQIYMTAYLAYDLSGLYDVMKKYENVDVDKNQLLKELISNKDFGKLRNPKFFSNIKSMGIDYVTASRWALKVNDQLCPADAPQTDSRRGYLFRDGICVLESHTAEGYTQDEVLEDFESTMQIAEIVLSGKGIKQAFGPEHAEYETEINYGSILNNPIKDIRSLGLVFNSEGELVDAKDQSLGGVLPKKDLNLVLKADATQDLNLDNSGE